MAETTSFKAIKDQYFFLDRNYNKIRNACTTKAERDKFRRDYAIARDNFWEARKRIFIENDPLVKSLIEELKSAQEKIKNLTDNLTNIVATLDAITAGVSLASSLIVLGSSSP
jgi:hypothetical protein